MFIRRTAVLELQPPTAFKKFKLELCRHEESKDNKQYTQRRGVVISLMEVDGHNKGTTGWTMNLRKQELYALKGYIDGILLNPESL